MITRVVVPTLLTIAAGVGFVEYRTGAISSMFSGAITVAVLDTGVDTRIEAISSRLAAKPGRNFFDDNDDITDSSGHGTKVALAVLQGCGASDCRILPLKMSKSGAGVTPQDLAKAIRFALEAGARVVNISFGLTAGSPELEAALAEAIVRKAVVVTAAGNGVSNPYRPEPLSKVYPQSYPEVVVVGASESLENPDPRMNFGEALDLVVLGKPEEGHGSSFAAAQVSGHVADVLRSFPRLRPEAVRQRLRESTQVPKSGWNTIAAPEVARRLGFGALDAARFRSSVGGLFTQNKEPLLRVFRDVQGVTVIEIGLGFALNSVQADWSCAKPPAAQAFTFDGRTYRKGRAKVVISPTKPSEVFPKDCPVALKLSASDGTIITENVTIQ